MNSRRALYLLAALVPWLLVGCGWTPAQPNVADTAIQLTLAFTVGDAIRLPAPPDARSPEVAAEMNELRALREALTSDQREAIERWDQGAVLRWNRIARDLVARYRLDPLVASRVYALLSVAQSDALHTAAAGQQHYQRTLPSPETGGVLPLVTSKASATYPSEHAAVAAASVAVLSVFFSGDAAWLETLRREQEESRLWAGVNCRSDIIAGDLLGRTIAARLVARADADFNAVSWDYVVPTGQGKWFIDDRTPMPPLMPQWGKQRPWLMDRPDQFRAPPPPAFGSPEFQAALAEVRHISDTRTDEQLRIAKFWADGAGTATPPGHWNQIADELITARGLGDAETAQTLAYLNMALMDAGISAWDTKYTYWLLRPSQADPAITTPVKLPHFPAYTSGHSTFSGAAAEFLGAIFPERQAALRAMAEEASMSRVYGGIHYRFDGARGLEAGYAIGRLAAERMRATP